MGQAIYEHWLADLLVISGNVPKVCGLTTHLVKFFRQRINWYKLKRTSNGANITDKDRK